MCKLNQLNIFINEYDPKARIMQPAEKVKHIEPALYAAKEKRW